jgi:hypothetical protein
MSLNSKRHQEVSWNTNMYSSALMPVQRDTCKKRNADRGSECAGIDMSPFPSEHPMNQLSICFPTAGLASGATLIGLEATLMTQRSEGK